MNVVHCDINDMNVPYDCAIKTLAVQTVRVSLVRFSPSTIFTLSNENLQL